MRSSWGRARGLRWWGPRLLPPAQARSARPRRHLWSGEEALSAENRLTAEQLAALAPGDVVTVESGQDFGRRRYASGTVVRVDAACITVSCPGPRGGKFVERYGLRDGLRVGGGTRAELVNPEPDEPAVTDQLRRQTRQIDLLYRAWSRRRDDVGALRELHDAIGDCLDGASTH